MIYKLHLFFYILIFFISCKCFSQVNLQVFVQKNNNPINLKLFHTSKYDAVPDFHYDFINKDYLFKTFSTKEIKETIKLYFVLYLENERYFLNDILDSLKNKNANDTFKFVVNLDSIYANKNSKREQENLAKLESLNLKKANIITRTDYLFTEATRLYNFYNKKIIGKNLNIIADFLYDEGFSREFDINGSLFKTIYKLFINYESKSENNLIDIITMKISTWYSYGFGNSYYNIEYDIYLDEFGYVVLNSELTNIFKNLDELKE